MIYVEVKNVVDPVVCITQRKQYRTIHGNVGYHRCGQSGSGTRLKSFWTSLLVVDSFSMFHSVQTSTLGISSSVTYVFSSLRIESSTYKSVASLRWVRGLDVASAPWCLAPARWTTSKSISDSRKRHRARLPEASSKFSIHLCASW